MSFSLPIDIHTHRLPAVPGTAIVQFVPCQAFAPGQALVSGRMFVPGHWYSVGLHPYDLATLAPDTVAAAFDRQVAPLLSHPQVVAIGETGFDSACIGRHLPLNRFSRSQWVELQQLNFRLHLTAALQTRLPLILHLVGDTAPLFQALASLSRAERAALPPLVVHGFRKKPQLARQLLDKGCCLSFGERFHEESLRLCPADRLFFETDDSADVRFDTLISRAAALRGTTPQALAGEVEGNVARVFGRLLR